MKKVMFGAFLVTLVAGVPAQAHGVRPVLVNIGGGWTIPVADGKDRFDTGGNFNIGVLFAPEKVPFGFQVEYGYNGLFLGVPTVIGKGGAEKIIEMQLNDEEKKMLDISANAVRDVVKLLPY